MVESKVLTRWKALAAELVAEDERLDRENAGAIERNRSFDANAPEAYDLATDAVPALIAAIEEARDVLREVEWRGADADYHAGYCPVCGGLTSVEGLEEAGFTTGHNTDCRLAAALR